MAAPPGPEGDARPDAAPSPGGAGPTRLAVPAVGRAARRPPALATAPEVPHLAEEAPTDELTLRLAVDEPPAGPERQATRPVPPPVPPSRPGGPPGPRTLLGILPTGEAATARAPATTPAPDAAEASRLASDYERTLREKAAHAEAQAAAPSRRGRVIALVALAVVLAGAAGTFAWFRAQARAEELERTLKVARVGLARDTRGALAKAAEVLARARDGSPHDPRLLSLVAQVNAVLAADHGDAAARALAGELTDPAVAGDGALAARWLLAATAAEKAEAARALVSTPAGTAPEPILHRLAGEILVVARRARRPAGPGWRRRPGPRPPTSPPWPCSATPGSGPTIPSAPWPSSRRPSAPTPPTRAR